MAFLTGKRNSHSQISEFFTEIICREDISASSAIMKKPEVIFENEDFIVINKPAGLLSIPDRTQSAESLKDMLIKQYGQIFTIHRLDKETSGLIVFAKNETTHKHLSRHLKKDLLKKYISVLYRDHLSQEEGIIEAAMMEHPQKWNDDHS